MQGPQLCTPDSLASQLLLHAGTTAQCTRFTCQPIITTCRDQSSVHQIHLPANYYYMQGPQLSAPDSLASQLLLHAGTTAQCTRFTCQPIITTCRDHSSVHQIHLPANYYCMQGPQLSAPDSLASQLLLHAGTTAQCTRFTCQPIIIACRDHSSVHQIHLPSQLLLHAGTTAQCTRFTSPANYYYMQGPQLSAPDSLASQLLLHAGTTALYTRFTCQPIITTCRDHSSVHQIHLPSQLLLHAGSTALYTRFTSQPIITTCRGHSSVHQIHLPSQLLLHAGTTAQCTRFTCPANYYCMQGPQLSAPDSLAQPIIIACRDHSSVHQIH